jgi:hypothetical protein
MMRYLSVLAAGLAAATPALVDLEVVLLGATVYWHCRIVVATEILFNTYHLHKIPGRE